MRVWLWEGSLRTSNSSQEKEEERQKEEEERHFSQHTCGAEGMRRDERAVPAKDLRQLL